MTALNRLIAALQDIDFDSFTDGAERSFAEGVLLNSLAKVRSPWDVAWNHNWVNPVTDAVVKTLIDAGIFKKWVEHGSKPETSMQLANITGTDPVLISESDAV